MSRPLRIAVICTPRSGSNWLRHILAGVYELAPSSAHSPADVGWDLLGPECVLGIHWHPTPRFLEQLERHGFRVVVLARHPLDVLISVLHFGLQHSDGESTQRWLGGEGGNERSIFAAMPRSTAFLNYSTGARAAALLSISHEWWQVPGCVRVRYEDLLNRPVPSLDRLAAELDVPPRRPVAEVLGATTLPKLRAVTGSRSHFWNGQAGLWRRLLTATDARRMAEAHAAVFACLGYEVDPDPDLDGASADANWINLLCGDLGDDLTELRNNELAIVRLQRSEDALATARAQLTALDRDRAELYGQFVQSQRALDESQARLLESHSAVVSLEAQLIESRRAFDELRAHLDRPARGLASRLRRPGSLD